MGEEGRGRNGKRRTCVIADRSLGEGFNGAGRGEREWFGVQSGRIEWERRVDICCIFMDIRATSLSVGLRLRL